MTATKTLDVISNEHICSYGFSETENLNLFSLNKCMRGFIEYWPLIIVTKHGIRCMITYFTIFIELFKIKYFKNKNHKFINQILKITHFKMEYDISNSIIIILRSLEDCILFGFVTPIIVPLAALGALFELVFSTF